MLLLSVYNEVELSVTMLCLYQDWGNSSFIHLIYYRVYCYVTVLVGQSMSCDLYTIELFHDMIDSNKK